MSTMNDLDVFARTLFGEAEAKNEEDAVAIACVIINRVNLPNWPDTISEVCLQPWQFSCWNQNDPNRNRILNAKGQWFDRCREIASWAMKGFPEDPTNRSTHYYATYVAKPKWAKHKTPVHAVPHESTGHSHLFFNNIDTPPPQNAKEALDQRRPLTSSRSIRGASVAGASVGLSVATEIVTEVQSQVEPLVGYADVLKILFLVVALAGIGLTIWARISDRKEGMR